MIIGINATNILSEGGILHLTNLLNYSEPIRDGFKEIIVWAPQKTLKRIPSKKWITLRDEKDFGNTLLSRLLTNIFKKNNAELSKCELLFNLSGININAFKKNVIFIQNQVPFEKDIIYKYYRSPKLFLRLFFLRFIYFWFIKKSIAVIFLSNYSQKTILDQINNHKIKSKVIPHGVNNNFFKFEYNNQLNEKNYFNIIYVSSSEPYKNHINLFKSLKFISDKKIHINLHLIGFSLNKIRKDYKLFNQYNKIINENNNFIKINVIEYIKNDNLLEFYEKMDLCVYPSTCETFGIGLLESLIMGIPVTCSDLNPMKEIAGKNAIYFDPFNPEDIADKIIYILCNNIQNNESFNRESYNLSEISKKTFSYINNIKNNY